MGEDALTTELTAIIESELWSIMILFTVTYLASVLIKDMAGALVNFILIKTDVFGVGSLVEFRGKRAVIRRIGIRRIKMVLEDSGDTAYILTADWKNLTLIIPFHKKL